MNRLICQKGFTLIELLVAVFILTIGILSINAMQTTAIKGNSRSAVLGAGTSWAAYQVEGLLALDYDDPLLLDDDDGGSYTLADGSTGIADGSTASPNGEYAIIWNIADSSPVNNTKTIEVYTIWTKDSVIRDVAITFIKSEVY